MQEIKKGKREQSYQVCSLLYNTEGGVSMFENVVFLLVYDGDYRNRVMLFIDEAVPYLRMHYNKCKHHQQNDL